MAGNIDVSKLTSAEALKALQDGKITYEELQGLSKAEQEMLTQALAGKNVEEIGDLLEFKTRKDGSIKKIIENNDDGTQTVTKYDKEGNVTKTRVALSDMEIMGITWRGVKNTVKNWVCDDDGKVNGWKVAGFAVGVVAAGALCYAVGAGAAVLAGAAAKGLALSEIAAVTAGAKSFGALATGMMMLKGLVESGTEKTINGAVAYSNAQTKEDAVAGMTELAEGGTELASVPVLGLLFKGAGKGLGRLGKAIGKMTEGKPKAEGKGTKIDQVIAEIREQTAKYGEDAQQMAVENAVDSDGVVRRYIDYQGKRGVIREIYPDDTERIFEFNKGDDYASGYKVISPDGKVVAENNTGIDIDPVTGNQIKYNVNVKGAEDHYDPSTGRMVKRVLPNKEFDYQDGYDRPVRSTSILEDGTKVEYTTYQPESFFTIESSGNKIQCKFDGTVADLQYGQSSIVEFTINGKPVESIIDPNTGFKAVPRSVSQISPDEIYFDIYDNTGKRCGTLTYDGQKYHSAHVNTKGQWYGYTETYNNGTKNILEWDPHGYVTVNQTIKPDGTIIEGRIGYKY